MRFSPAIRWLAWPALGAVLGVLLLHPAMIAVHRFGRASESAPPVSIWFPRGVEWFLYAAVGITTLALGRYLRSARRRLRVGHARHRLLAGLIAGGEKEDVEFKASARWDHRSNRLNHELELAVARTMAAFMNGRGGTLLLGVSDSGAAVGLDADYRTLRRPTADGFEQFLTGLATTRLGGAAAALLHVSFTGMAGRELCRVDVEPSRHPVYLRDDRGAHYYVRSGNTTRELDVAEALIHLERRAHTSHINEGSPVP